MILDFSAIRSIPAKEIGNRGFFATEKNQDGIAAYESQIERDFMLLLDHAEDVELFQHQPYRIQFSSSLGMQKYYTPDVLVVFSNGLRLLVEIKDEDTLQNEAEKFQERWNAAHKWAELKGMTFLVFTERNIRTPRFTNIWFTLGASKVQNSEYMSLLNGLLTSKGEGFNNLCYKLAEEANVEVVKASQIICYAIYHGYVFVDSFSTAVLTGNTLIRKKDNQTKMPYKPLWFELD